MALESAVPTVGIILLDDPDYEKDEYVLFPHDAGPLSRRPVGWFNHPGTWACPTIQVVARGCSGADTAERTPQGVAALDKAAGSLEHRVDVITSNCAYMAFMDDAFAGVQTPHLFGGFDLLPLVNHTASSIVMLVSDEGIVRQLASDVPSEVRLVGLDGMPEWDRFNAGGETPSQPLDRLKMAHQLRQRIQRDVKSDGRPDSVVLECSGFSQFAGVVRESYGAPVLDSRSIVHSLLGLHPPPIALL